MVPQSFHRMGDEGNAVGCGMTGSFAVCWLRLRLDSPIRNCFTPRVGTGHLAFDNPKP